MTDQSHNFNAHAAARVAASIWSEEYAGQKGGMMDFWNTLPKWRKKIAAAQARAIRMARPYEGEE